MSVRGKHYLISNFAGTQGVNALVGDYGPATSAQLNYPSGVFIASTGVVYIADTYNNVVRRVEKDGIISTIGAGYYSPASPTQEPTTGIYVQPTSRPSKKPTGSTYCYVGDLTVDQPVRTVKGASDVCVVSASIRYIRYTAPLDATINLTYSVIFLMFACRPTV
jgi:hypothetical protein